MNHLIERIDSKLQATNYEAALSVIDTIEIDSLTGSLRNEILWKKADILFKLQIFSFSGDIGIPFDKKTFSECLHLIQEIRNPDKILKVRIILMKVRFMAFLDIEQGLAKLIEEVEKIDFSHYPSLYPLYLHSKASFFNTQPRNNRIKLAEESVEMSDEMDQKSHLVWSLVLLSMYYHSEATVDKEKLIRVREHAMSIKNVNIKGYILQNLMWAYWNMNDVREGLEISEIVKPILNKIDKNGVLLKYYMILGHIEKSRGHSKLAVGHFKKSQSLAKDDQIRHHLAAYIAMAYLGAGEIEEMFESIKSAKKYTSWTRSIWVHYVHFLYAIKVDETDLIDSTYEKLKHALAVIEANNPMIDKLVESWKILSEAFMLKRSDRMKDKMNALQLLENIIPMKTTAQILPEDYALAMLNLLDLLLFELKTSGDINIIKDINQYMDRFDAYITDIQNHYLRVEFYIIKSRLNFVQLKFDEASSILDEARNFIDKHQISSYNKVIDDEVIYLNSEREKLRPMLGENVNDVKMLSKQMNFNSLLNNVMNKRKVVHKESIKNYLKEAMLATNLFPD